MVFKVYNYTDNDDVKVVDKKGPFQVIEWQRDLSVMPWNAQAAYFSSLMNVRRRQLICELNGKNTVILQAGAMQWTVGNVNATTGVHGVGDFLGKMVRGASLKTP